MCIRQWAIIHSSFNVLVKHPKYLVPKITSTQFEVYNRTMDRNDNSHHTVHPYLSEIPVVIAFFIFIVVFTCILLYCAYTIIITRCPTACECDEEQPMQIPECTYCQLMAWQGHTYIWFCPECGWKADWRAENWWHDTIFGTGWCERETSNNGD